MLPIPVERILVPAGTPSVPDGFVRQQHSLLRGVPADIVLDAQTTLTVVVPTGLATLWRDAEASQLVCSSDQGYAPVAPLANPRAAVIPTVCSHVPARILVRFSRKTVAVVPLVAGGRHAVAGGGNPDSGLRVEFIVMGWALYAGSIRGVGDFGSYVDLAWRRCDAGQSTFHIPPLDPRVAARLPLVSTILSEVGGTEINPQYRLRRKRARK
jgi:hypothetical protein